MGTKDLKTLPSRAEMISKLRQELHIHKFASGWYITSRETKICGDKERCIHVIRKHGETVDQTV